MADKATATQGQPKAETAPAPAPIGTVHCLCDGEPVTIYPGDWWDDGKVKGCDYTVDATGARHWGFWPSHRFQPRPK